jgi:aldose 1-epimerase
MSIMAATLPNAQTKDPVTGWTICKATHGKTTLTLVPEAGCNTLSIRHGDFEILSSPKELKDLAGFRYGNPLLYPTPNRVRNAKFTFGGREYRFQANEDTNFLHGLVHSVPWKLAKTEQAADRTTFHCELAFEPGTPHHQLFPHRHTLGFAVTVSDGAVRYTYTVDNSKGDGPLPFGFALHPWFLYQGTRANTFLSVPATHWMEAENLLPTGKLIGLDGHKLDLRQPRTLEGFVIDDVYFGMTPERPAVIDFREKGLKITLSASADFTHMVVYTPAEKPWFCVENQTCSTDAHNLDGRGLKTEAHLQVVPAGQSKSGWVEYRFSTAK